MIVPMERVENRILTIRGHRVMLDADLAARGGRYREAWETQRQAYP